MAKFLKYTLFIFCIIILVFVVYVAVLFTMTEPSVYRARVAQGLSQALGRKVTIDGPIHWSFYPVVGIKINQLHVANPQSFEAKQPMAQFQKIHAGVKTWPLIFKFQFRFHHIVAKNGEINLIMNQKGHNNWRDLIQKFQKEEGRETVTTQYNQLVTSIDRISIQDLDVHWVNRKKAHEVHLSDIDLEIHGFHLISPYHVMLSFQHKGTHHPTSYWKFDTQIDPEVKQQRHRLDPFKLEVRYPQTQARVDIHGALQIDDLLNKPSLTGHLKVVSHPRRIAKAYGHTWPDGMAHQLDFNTDLALSPSKLKLQSLQGRLDQSPFQGQFTLRHFFEPDLHFKLHFDSFNLPKAWRMPSTKTGSRTFKLPKPPEFLQHAKLDGEITVDNIQGPLPVHRLHLRFHNIGHTYKLTYLNLEAFDGEFEAHAVARYTGQQWYSRGVLSIKKLNLGLLTRGGKTKSWVEGRLFTSVHFQTHGDTVQEVLSHFRGHGGMVVFNGRLLDFEIHKEVKRALRHVHLHEYARKLPHKAHTPFKKVSLNYRIKNLQLENTNVGVNTQYLVLKGRGRLNIDNKKIHFQITGALGFLPQLKIPLYVTGTYEDPNVGVDFSRLVEIFVEDLESIPETIGREAEEAIMHLIP